ncbi:glycerophosphodiester phosphodiesterase [Corynebacterium sp. TAE3-ERU16]|nr:glycerophosphodiester phosphodiesterase family protein [Corynebacterium sp. TAE3-ERU16]MBV7294246.1 glycerophosphodiester phosphodiesterase [Corynebacterium sp. TAE3-ERU16]
MEPVTDEAPAPGTRIIAHRGDCENHPEMTMPAFESALELGADGVECDVRLSSCGTVMCIHDPVVNRVSDGSGRVSALSLAELSRLNFGTPVDPQPPLRLDDLLELISAYPGRELFIETKHPLRFGRELEEQVTLRLRYFGLLDDPRIRIISFSALSILRMRQLAPAVPRIHLCRDRCPVYDPVVDARGAVSGWGISVGRARENSSRIGYRGLPGYMWTVDDPADMAWAADHGVRWMATNRPGTARRVLGR